MFDNAFEMYTVKRVNSLLLRPSISHPGMRQTDRLFLPAHCDELALFNSISFSYLIVISHQIKHVCLLHYYEIDISFYFFLCYAYFNHVKVSLIVFEIGMT